MGDPFEQRWEFIQLSSCSSSFLGQLNRLPAMRKTMPKPKKHFSVKFSPQGRVNQIVGLWPVCQDPGLLVRSMCLVSVTEHEPSRPAGWTIPEFIDAYDKICVKYCKLNMGKINC